MNINISKSQSISLFILRILIGWHLLYEGLVKVQNPDWTSAGYLMDSKGILADFFQMLAANPTLLNIVDLMNQWGLVLIGIGLILGLFTRWIAYAGMTLVLLYYLSSPPLLGLEYSVPTEGNYLIVNKNLIEAAALLLLAVFPAGRQYGLDLLLTNKK